MRSICVSALPSAGLGNKLFSWASGVIFSHINNCPHVITGLTKVHLGPILRREKSLRFYKNYFVNERTIPPLSYYLKSHQHLTQKDADKKLEDNSVYIFNEIPHWSDQFHKLREYRSLVNKTFWESLTPKIRNRIEEHTLPRISVHIRMGDFKEMNNDEDFSKMGSTRTPLVYFKKRIELIRNFVEEDWPVTVFSDGYDHELQEILSMNKVNRAKDDLDIVHLSVMSKSDILIMSAGSTFSFWAGFLCDGILINHYQHLHRPIRGEEINKIMFEGGVPNEELSPLLQKNLRSLSIRKA